MKSTSIGSLALPLAAFALSSCDANESEAPAGEAGKEYAQIDGPPADRSQITLGNGEENAIATEGIVRSGSTFTLPEVTIARAGFVVVHPFRDGEPVGNEYVAAQPVAAGTSSDVAVTVEGGVAEGDMLLFMLHNDMNDDGVFDFGDGEDDVPDAPTFEGTTMIAHPVAAPAETAG